MRERVGDGSGWVMTGGERVRMVRVVERDGDESTSRALDTVRFVRLQRGGQ